MRRESANFIRGLAEDWLPPVLRDSWLFRFGARTAFGPAIEEYAKVREQAPIWSDEEWRAFYASNKGDQGVRRSDNSEATVHRIIEDVLPSSVLDVGCGTGYLLERLGDARHDLGRLIGVDLVIPDTTRSRRGVEWIEAAATKLPQGNASVDTVVCTHTLEHLPDLPAAVSELRRVARRRLIIVVPRERPYRWTYNAHLHFFAYEHQLTLAMQPHGPFICTSIGRDLYYREDRAERGATAQP